MHEAPDWTERRVEEPSRARIAPSLRVRRVAGTSLVLSIIVSCTSPQSRPPIAATPRTTVSGPEQKGRALAETIAHHSWHEAEAHFSAKMAAFLPETKLASLWMEVERSAGPWVAIDAATVEPKGSSRVVVALTCRFEKHRVALQVTLDEHDRVVGLLLGPAPSEFEDDARRLVAALSRSEFGAVYDAFDDTMRSALPKGRLEQVWTRLLTEAGPFVAVERVGIETHGAYGIAFARCSFGRGERLVKVAYDADDHRVAGLFFLPASTEEAWAPPPYANAIAFDERDVRVGTEPALPAVLSMPKGAGPFPAVVLVHGSGPQDQDETVGGVKVFRDLASGLASRSIAVLRYMKRTRVEPHGVVTVKDEVLDAVHAALGLLRVTPGIDGKRLVVLGHSQGGYLAPRVAHDDPGVAALIVMAGPTRPVQDMILEQLQCAASRDPDAARARAVEEAKRFKAAVEDPALTKDQVLPPLADAVPGAYFLDLRGYHPEQVAAALTIPILILQGDNDFQVTHVDFEGWKSALGKLGRVTFRRYPSLNHLFVETTAPSTGAEYEQPAHVDPAPIDDIVRWIDALPR
jgi:fermentation-respiration switch protein FrsA (DUF1100 family)